MRRRIAPALLALGPLLAVAAPPPIATTSLDADAAARFAALALKCLHQEFPNHISHTLGGEADVRWPRALTPAFHGSYDWRSAVHGHGLLVRLTRLFPAAPFAPQARAEVSRSLTAPNISAEVAYLRGEGRASFERPYGLAWLLQLAAELRGWDDPDARRWSAALQPLESQAAARLKSWLPKLHYPIRIGEHDQTAFSFGLVWDWAGLAGDQNMRDLLSDAAQRFYSHDRNCPLAYEPSGEDFLSPCLAEADAMRRILPQDEFVRWFAAVLPHVDLEPTRVTDVTDGKLYHLAGLNLSRAWMLEGILSKLPVSGVQSKPLAELAGKLRLAGLESIKSEHYEG